MVKKIQSKQSCYSYRKNQTKLINIITIKKLFKLLLLLFVVSSCTSNPENLKAVPQNSSTVVVIDLYSIIKKGKLYDLSEFKFLKTFKKEISNESEVLDNLIDDPEITGINYKADVFGYIINLGKKQFNCLAIELDDSEKFTKFITDLIEEGNKDIDIEDLGYNYIRLDDAVAMAWDKNKFIAVVADNYKSRKCLEKRIEKLICKHF